MDYRTIVYELRANRREVAREFVRGREPANPAQRPNDITDWQVLSQINDAGVVRRRVGDHTGDEIIVTSEYRIAALGRRRSKSPGRQY